MLNLIQFIIPITLLSLSFNFIVGIIIFICFNIYTFITPKKEKDLKDKNTNEMIVGDKLYNVITPLQKLHINHVKNVVNTFNLNVNVILLNLTGEINIGMCVRNCMAFGVKNIYILGKKRYDKRTTVGCHHYMNIHFITKLPNLDFVYLIEQNGKNINNYKFQEISSNKPINIIMGNEANGIPNDFIKDLKIKYEILSIPQCGFNRSLNVSIANGIILYEIQKQYYKNSCVEM